MTFHRDFHFIENLVYAPCGLTIENLIIDNEGGDYGAAEYTVDGQRIKFRVGKTTPTKIGQFVTFWKRIGNGPIMPYDLDDPFDLLVVLVRSGDHLGQFTFPKIVLWEKGILSKEGHGGKRATRLYPSWVKTENSQAKKSQCWQLEFFKKLERVVR